MGEGGGGEGSQAWPTSGNHQKHKETLRKPLRTNRKAPRWGPPSLPPHVLEMIGFIGFICFYAGFHLFLLVWIGFYLFSLGFLRLLGVFTGFA